MACCALLVHCDACTVWGISALAVVSMLLPPSSRPRSAQDVHIVASNSSSCLPKLLLSPLAGNEVVGVDGVEAAAWQLQRDSWLKFEVSQQRPSTAGTNRPAFIAAPTFEKRRSGYVFKTDAMGTGYYIDAKAIKVILRCTKERLLKRANPHPLLRSLSRLRYGSCE